MKKQKKEISLKHIRKVAERINELYRDMRGISVPLENKIFVGHWRHFKVRDDVLRSSIGEQVQKVVDACDHWVLGKKHSPKSYKARTEVGFGSGRDSFFTYIQDGQGLVSISQEQFDKENFPPFFRNKWFYVRELYRNYGSKNVVRYRYYPKVPDYMVEFAYKAAYVTEKFIPNGDAESELHYLKLWMEENNGYARYFGKNDNKDWDRGGPMKQKVLKKATENEIKLEVNDYNGR